MDTDEENAQRRALEGAGWRTWDDQHAGYTIRHLEAMLAPFGLRLVVEERDWGRLPRGRQELWFRVDTLRPMRFQRSRARGSKLPPNTVCVTRGTRWGNPFKVGQQSPNNYRITMDAEHVCQIFEGILEAKKEFGAAVLEEFLAPLRGKNLACWCKPGAPCHADVLLKWANKRSRKKS